MTLKICPAYNSKLYPTSSDAHPSSTLQWQGDHRWFQSCRDLQNFMAGQPAEPWCKQQFIFEVRLIDLGLGIVNRDNALWVRSFTIIRNIKTTITGQALRDLVFIVCPTSMAYRNNLTKLLYYRVSDSMAVIVVEFVSNRTCFLLVKYYIWPILNVFLAVYQMSGWPWRLEVPSKRQGSASGLKWIFVLVLTTDKTRHASQRLSEEQQYLEQTRFH